MSDDMLSQDEIDALLKGDSTEDTIPEDIDSEVDEQASSIEENIEEKEPIIDQTYEGILTDIEIDALGEMGNISMGTAATTLSTLLNKKVSITTPSVIVTTPDTLSNEYEAPLVAVDVSYSAGLEGSNIMILKTDDVKVITDLMMGKDEVDRDRELTELDLSAASEAMNQMMGSSATSISEMLGMVIDIKPPKAEEITFSEGQKTIDLLKTNDPIIKVSFRMEIGDYIDSNMMQLVPIEFGKSMVKRLMNDTQSSEPIVEAPVKDIKTDQVSESEVTQPNIEDRKKTVDETVARIEKTSYAENTSKSRKVEEPVTVTKPNFQSFDTQSYQEQKSEIGLVGDIPVEITVELGRTNKKIEEILEFGTGTIIELEKLVGESLEVFANGKYIASGEVVVIDDSFGIRITEIDANKKII